MIFINCAHPCVAADVIVVVGVGMLTDVTFGIVVDISLDTSLFCIMIGVDVDMFPDGMLDVSAADMLTDIRIVVMATPAATLELVVGLVYSVDVLLDVLSVVVIDVVPGIDVDMLTDENENGLADVLTPLDFTLSSP